MDNVFNVFLEASKNIGAGIARICLFGTSAGVGIVFCGLMISYGRKQKIKHIKNLINTFK
jgi:F0F1-type ATP synthase membrane subunit c/vacuolar-type H+-ATPase subunit K